jgi:hypothetical protein
MAKFTLVDAYISVNAVVLSDHGNQVGIEGTADEQDFTGFGATFKEYGKGLKDATVTCQFFQDFAAASVDATLWPLFTGDTTFTVEIRATSAARSATNPAYVMTARLFAYTPLSGDIGNPSQTPVTFRNASQTGLQRLTA